jgi:hypothetical protein
VPAQYHDLAFNRGEAFGSKVAISSVTSGRPRGNGIGSSNGRFQPVGGLRKEIGAILRERHIAARSVHREMAVSGCCRSPLPSIKASNKEKAVLYGSRLCGAA